MDLHLVHLDGPLGTYRSSDDCYFANKQPSWFGDPDANPTLNVDDNNGLGPEVITIEAPLPIDLQNLLRKLR